MLEGYSVLSFVAAKTERLRLGLLVTGVTYRHPGLLAKTVTTLDVLSGGRAMLGIGAAWYEREHLALGVPYPPVAERFERLEETIQICEQMWSDNDGPYDGKHYQLAETICVPRPLQSPRPPILIGGGGEKKTLRLVAKYADACNLFGSSVADVRHKLEVLRGPLRRRGPRLRRHLQDDHRAAEPGRPGGVPAGDGAVRRARHRPGGARARRCRTPLGTSPCSARRSSGPWPRSGSARMTGTGTTSTGDRWLAGRPDLRHLPAPRRPAVLPAPLTDSHDELLFVIIHQVYELWFKQILHEAALLQDRLERGDSAGALATAHRIAKILKTVVGQMDILETMTPRQFAAFRPELGSSSGFQSAQFRYLEAVLGRRDFTAGVRRARPGAGRRSRRRRPLFASLLRLPERAPAGTVPAAALGRDPRQRVAGRPAGPGPARRRLRARRGRPPRCARRSSTSTRASRSGATGT